MLTGSDDGNVRIWKAKASDKLGVVNARERAAIEYRESLKERWKMDTEVGKIVRWVSSLHLIFHFLSSENHYNLLTFFLQEHDTSPSLYTLQQN